MLKNAINFPGIRPLDPAGGSRPQTPAIWTTSALPATLRSDNGSRPRFAWPTAPPRQKAGYGPENEKHEMSWFNNLKNHTLAKQVGFMNFWTNFNKCYVCVFIVCKVFISYTGSLENKRQTLKKIITHVFLYLFFFSHAVWLKKSVSKFL